MLTELLIRDVHEMHPMELELECQELEDAYCEALQDNAGFDILTLIWRRIQALRTALEEIHAEEREDH
ncbi:MAG TPA: hypothetical protein VNT20_21395 [Flavisolibacter sp.]|jgi:hypothetical protein|nr:hypothetical protein [Flavisolibacter sp.]